MIKDFFYEIIRRMEWAKDRKLTPEIRQTSAEIICRIPLDEAVSYTVSIREVKESGVLIQSLFPDGEPHYCFERLGISPHQTFCLISAAVLIVYGTPM
jgi:hypothetical protein